MEKVSKSKKPKTSEASKALNKQEKKLISVLSYIGILFFIPLFVDKYEGDVFIRFHAKQGLVLFLFALAVSPFTLIPHPGWLIGFIAYIAWIVLGVIGIINALKGKQSFLPLIGKFAKKFKF